MAAGKSKTVNIKTSLMLVAAACDLFTAIQPAFAQSNPNPYTNTVSGKWENGANFLFGPPDSTESIYFTNTGTKTVTIDATTSSINFSNTLTVTNLFIGAPAGFLNTLWLTNAGTSGPLQVSGTVGVYANGELDITNSALNANTLLDIGAVGGGTMNLFSGVVNPLVVEVAWSFNSSGTLNISGGTLNIPSGSMEVAGGGGSCTATVNVTGGELDMDGSGMYLGTDGTGIFNMTGGVVDAAKVTIGSAAGSTGIMNISGGTFTAHQFVIVGNLFGARPCSLFISSNATVNITNISQTATVDVATNSTLTLNGGLMNVDKLELTHGGNFFLLAGALATTQPFTVDNGSRLNVASTLTTLANFTLGLSAGTTSFVTISNGGNLIVSGAALGIGNDGTLASGAGIGNFTVDNATVSAGAVMLGSTAGGQGLLNLQNNAVLNVANNFTAISGSLTSTSTVTVAAGSTLSAPNGNISIGSAGSAQLNIGGTVIASTVSLGGASSSGAITISSGLLKAAGLSANSVTMNGGTVDISAGSMFIGQGHNAALQINNGAALAGTMYIGYSPGFSGTYTQTGGTLNVATNVIVGDCISGAYGIATLTGGTMYVTNATHTAVLDVRNGTFALNPGATLVVDTLIVTNPCAHFINLGGTLTQNHPAILSANLDVDGDGQSNGAEAAAGTDPLNPNSTFRLTNIARTNGSVRLDWTTVGGHSYGVQTNGNSSTGTFNDLAPAIPVPGTAEGTTNYIHTNGAASNTKFYRVRLRP
jgi:hypothetical protein